MPASRRTVVRGGLVKFRQRVLRARTGPRTGHVARRGLPWRWRCEHFPPSLPLFPPSLPVFPSSLPLLISFLSPPLLVPQARMRLLLLPPLLGSGLAGILSPPPPAPKPPPPRAPAPAGQLSLLHAGATADPMLAPAPLPSPEFLHAPAPSLFPLCAHSSASVAHER